MLALVLPIELFEHAIDTLGDEDSLRATSLVCKAWLPRSRLNLFRVIRLSVLGHLDRLVCLVFNAPHLLEYVEEIEVSENTFLGVLRPAETIVARLPAVLSAHPIIQPRLFAVHNQFWLPTRYGLGYLRSLSQLSSVTSLELNDVTFTTLADFSIILRALSHLKSLSANHLECERQLDPEIASDIGCTMASLTFLRVSSTQRTTVVDWLFRYNTFPSLRRVDCKYALSASRDDGQAIGALWENAGSTLEEISINISKRDAGAFPLRVIERQLDLSHCHILRTLRFDCRHDRNAIPDWTWLSWLLSHLTSHTLRSIEFAFESSSHALASMPVFAAELDRVLTSALFFDGLEAIFFAFDYRDEADPDDGRFVNMFPALRDSHLLRVYNLDQRWPR
ncbi:uncharacterized protein TRAVEDRAFT_50408 [Trametes versicolor FP-101664 SS1]|uniref:uncharacterized protein n=1 Tax=Trametes versicolor (strain FP-101664) TaxID=717944 RepID=UPI0004623D78|nr:uncharacterized protein TRAVEDRAFT_50408 [Trametes versicolor FP-101664 SS1]EIW55919.1 hypothetical protein TRAVEDRAFT_50408 [Trametes versicolor FP-101664 SS1]